MIILLIVKHRTVRTIDKVKASKFSVTQNDLVVCVHQYTSCSIDPVTGAPMKEDPSPLDEMTAEEKEREAEELEGLLKKLDK